MGGLGGGKGGLAQTIQGGGGGTVGNLLSLLSGANLVSSLLGPMQSQGQQPQQGSSISDFLEYGSPAGPGGGEVDLSSIGMTDQAGLQNRFPY